MSPQQARPTGTRTHATRTALSSQAPNSADAKPRREPEARGGAGSLWTDKEARTQGGPQEGTHGGKPLWRSPGHGNDGPQGEGSAGGRAVQGLVLRWPMCLKQRWRDAACHGVGFAITTSLQPGNTPSDFLARLLEHPRGIQQRPHTRLLAAVAATSWARPGDQTA